MRNPLKDMPRWIQVAIWGTLALMGVAIIVPAALRTTVEGFRGDLDPTVIAAREHEEKVELAEAKAQDTINAQKTRIQALNKILSGMGTKDIPVGVFLSELPACECEDGSTQNVCVWDGRKQGNGVGAIVVNLDKGKISFFPQTNGWVVNN